MNTYPKNSCNVLLFCSIIALLVGCSTQKDTIANRKLQNLSARYNLIYNSNVLLDEYLEQVNQTQQNNYDNFLPLYYAPDMADANSSNKKIKELDEIDHKARVIISEKNFSNYIDDAYILLGKKNFYEGKFYNAVEYFDYVASAYKKDHKTYLNALNWKVRSLIELRDFKSAEQFLDTIKIELDSVKRHKSEPLATLAQMSMLRENDKQAISYLESALKAKPSSLNRIKWTYTLAQLYENEKEYQKSLAAYRKVEKSNAPFDMYFNAKLSKVRINELLEGQKFDKKAQLLKMLKDDKNVDFVDQIYYEIAEDYYTDKNYRKAEDYYKRSAKSSTVNNYQKGLSYLKIADLNFKELSNYQTAKLYYDSTALALPKNYPGYDAIINKIKNLSYLQERYEAIATQDTLQRIALLPEAERAGALEAYFTSLLPSTPVAGSEQQPASTGRANVNYKPETKGTFYFGNANTISKGFNDFKKRWGNRKLANNWRQSVKSLAQSNQVAQTEVVNDPGNLPSNPDVSTPEIAKDLDKAKNYLDSLPLTPAKLEKSNQKIILAYLEIGSFYQQVLNDKPEAIKVYETLLKRFPNNEKLEVIYYSLYLAYQEIDPSKSDFYKNLVLNNYPSSVYAKTILDPNFSVKQNQLEATLNKEYENLFAQLEDKKFKEVINKANEINQRFPNNSLEAQYAYLRAIAIGRTSHIDQLIPAFREITEKYKTDRLIKPLVEQHLLYINAHLNDFKKRKIALVSYDPNEIPFIAPTPVREAVQAKAPVIANVPKAEEKPTSVNTQPKVEEKKVTPKKPLDSLVAKRDSITVLKPIAEIKKDSISKPMANVALPKDTIAKSIKVSPPKDSVATAIVAAPEPIKDNLFSLASSSTYYYVVAVNTVSISLSTSRFGIGQFNRGNYTGSNLRHQLKELEKDQLILVGDFNSMSEVKAYQQNIKNQLGVIIKVPAANYSTFVISKENLDKITDRETLNRYIRFSHSNEL